MGADRKPKIRKQHLYVAKDSTFGRIWVDEEDMQVLAQSHNFVAEILDDIIYSRNADNLLDRVLDRIGIFFGLERIAIITKSEDEHSNKLLCQWSKDSRSTTAFDVLLSLVCICS